MNKDLIVNRIQAVKATPGAVWEALTTREMIKQYFFGTEAISDWKPGSTLIFQGEWEGSTYHDKGNILAAEPGRLLKYDYWSAFSGLVEIPENYSLVTYQLEDRGEYTEIHLQQQGFASEEARNHAEGGWAMVLENLKKLLEER